MSECLVEIVKVGRKKELDRFLNLVVNFICRFRQKRLKEEVCRGGQNKQIKCLCARWLSLGALHKITG